MNNTAFVLGIAIVLAAFELVQMVPHASKLVVVGGGFGGLYTALSAIEMCPQMDVTLIDKKVCVYMLSIHTNIIFR